MKKLRMMFTAFLLTIVAVLGIDCQTVEAGDGVTYGADVGWLNQLENQGVVWVDDNGVQKDALQLLKDKGVEAVRIRAFVNPDPSFQWTKDNGQTCYLGYADIAGVLYTAERANELGMDINLVLHYSDHFADPQYQDIPEQWKDATAKELEKYVYDYTYYVMTELANKGIYPKWVEVGNEINGGILYPYGDSTTNMEQMTAYLNSGYDAVKAVSPNTKVVTHLANLGNRTSISVTDFTWFFDNFLNTYGGKTDVIGMSYYPYWLGYDIDGVSVTLNDMVQRYGKEVMICETGEKESNPDKGYELLRKEINVLKSIPNNKGVAIFYWEPEANSTLLPDSYILGATEVVGTNMLKFTSTLNAFSTAPKFLSDGNAFAIYNCNSKKSLNVASGSVENSAVIEQYPYDDWDSQRWTFEKVDGSYYKITNVNSGKVLEIGSLSTEEGAVCSQYEYNGGWNQMWEIVTDSTGQYKIKNRWSGLYLGISNSSTDDGAWCVQMADGGSANTSWYFLITE